MDGLVIKVVERYRDAIEALECDGATRVLHYALNQIGFPHKCYVGAVTYGGAAADTGGEVEYSKEIVVAPHYWIEFGIGDSRRVVDCTLGRAVNFGTVVNQDLIPCKVFDPKGWAAWSYEGELVNLKVSQAVFDVLTAKLDWPDV